MANQDIKMRVRYSAEFDTSKISEGLKDIKKQISNSRIGEDLRKQLETALNKVEVNIPALEKMSAKGEFNTKELEAFQKLVQQVSKDMQALDQLAAKADFTKAFSSADTEKLKQFEKQLSDVENKIKSTKQEIIKNFSGSEQGKINGKNSNSLNTVIEQLLDVPPDKIEDKLNEIVKEAENQTKNAQEKLSEVFSKSNKFKTENDLVNFLYGKDSGVSIEHGNVTRLKDQLNAIREGFLSFDEDTPIEDVKAHIESFIELINDPAFQNTEGKKTFLSDFIPEEVLQRLKEFQDDIPGLKELLGGEQLKLLADGEAEKLRITQEQAAFLKQRLDELTNTQKLTADQAKAVMEALGGMNKKIDEGSDKLKKEKVQADALNATFGSLASRITNSISALTVFNKSIQIVHKAIDSVKELDAAFTQIAIVSEQSNESAWKMFDSFNSLAKQYSITTKDLTEGAKLFYQQGLNAADTMKMVEASTVSAALGEVTMTEAANTLTAAIQGYNESAAVAMDYTDKIAMVGAVSAADFNELSVAMEKTASSAYTAGIDFDHLLGYLGKMIEVTREAPANLGTAMKTIIARFEDMKKDPMAILEDGVSANKVEAALATIGIALRNSEGEFRALQDVMDELGGKWNSLTRNQQAYIATVAAGSRQQSRFLALMNNYDRTLELVTESQNSAGAAAEQYAVYQDSAAAATARLTAAWEEFYTKIVNSEQIIWVLDRLKDLVEVMTEVGPVVSAIGASVGALGLQTIIKGILPKITSSIAETAIMGKTASISIGGLLKTSGALILSLGKVILVAAGVAAAIAGIIWVANKLDKALHKDRETINQLTKEIQDSNKKIEEYGKNTNSLEKLMKRYEELSNKVYLSREEQEELNDVINQINENSERAIVSIKANGDAHLDNADSVRKEIEAKKDLIKFEANQKYKNQQEIFSMYEQGKEVTSDQAKSANLDSLADYLEIKNDETVEAYNKIQDAIKNYEDLIYSDEFYNLSNKDINKEQLNQIAKSYGLSGENNTFEDIREKIFSNAQIEAEKMAQEKGIPFSVALFQAQEEAKQEILKAAQDFVELVYKDDIEFLEKYNNEEYEQNEFEKAKKQSLIQLYESRSLADERYKALIDVFEKSGLTADEFKEVVGDENKDEEAFLDKYSKALEEYNKSEKTQEDVQKLIEVLTNGKEKIADALQEWIDNAIKQSFTSTNQKQQFINENNDLFSKRPDVYARVMSGSITNDELTKMGELAKTSEFKDNDKFSLFNLFAEDDTILNDLINDYSKKIANGLYQEADIVKQAMIELLANKGITGPAAEKLADFFVEDYQSEIDKRLSKSEGDYKTAQTIYNKESKEALSNDEYNFLKTQDPNIDRYVAINEEGEKYLSILGKITVLENTRNEYANSLRLKMKDNEDSLEITKGLLEEVKSKTNEEVEGRENLIKTYEQEINNLETSNNLLDQQLKTTTDIVDKSMSLSFKENLSQAEQTYDNINKIGKALGEAQQNAGQLSFATAQSILALDDAYYQYINIVDGMVTLDAEGAEKMREHEKQKYDDWLKQETARLDGQIAIYEAENQLIEEYFNNSAGLTEEDKQIKLQALKTELEKKEEQLNNLNKAEVDSDKQALTKNSEFLTYLESQWSDYYTHLAHADKVFKDGLTSVNPIDTQSLNQFFTGVKNNSGSLTAAVDIKVDKIDWEKNPEEVEKQLKEKLEANLKRIEILQGVKAKLKDLSPAFKEAFEKGLSEAAKGGSKALKDVAKELDNLLDALKDLDDLLINIKKDLKDITVDYNPFTDLFEAWEHEWDYYYNIKRLLQQIDTQGKYIDNIISADYVSTDKRIEAEQAKMGNILAKMAANDTYIEALRAGMSQTAVELMKDYGEYYKVDPTTGQLYQTDKNLNDINELMNERKEEIYNLQKLQNEKENDLALENAKLDALEKEKSAYEDILSTIESQLDKLKDNEDITANISELQSQQTELKAKIKITDSSIEAQKDKIQNMEDGIQDIEIGITLKDQSFQQLENYVSDMEDKVSEYEEYWENLNSTIAEQQELLSNLNEILKGYIDTAISTQQELYDAIVENYQNEINQKKKEYDYLKQLDNDYLQSIKDNINKQRQAREDANKQKSYQQNIQRAQLLQMDTSGVYRNELASLNKEIENQRQELYDDLVDKQVEALEKEIEKRHELYDKEVAALEERLAYYQENAILLWEMVNAIVAEGASTMMATLENTVDYINSSELAKEQQRQTWEYNVKKTFDGVQNHTIETLNNLVDAGNKFIIDKYPEIGSALDDYKAVFVQASDAINEYNNQLLSSRNILNNDTLNATQVFQSILDSFMITWNERTNEFTGYAKNWTEITNSLKKQTEDNLNKLKDLYDEQGKAYKDLIGSIEDLDETLRETTEEMYDDFIEERRRYRDELESLIKKIKNQISAAIQDTADAIRSAANSISYNNNDNDDNDDSGGGSVFNPGGDTGESDSGYTGGYSGGGNLKGWKAQFAYSDGKTFPHTGIVSPKGTATYDEVYQNWYDFLKKLRVTDPGMTSWGLTYFKQGGYADFTGPAWLDGTKTKPEAILNAKQTKLFESMISSLERTANNSNINSSFGSSYNIGDINTTIQVEKLDNNTDIEKVARQVENRIMKTIRNRVTVSIS